MLGKERERSAEGKEPRAPEGLWDTDPEGKKPGAPGSAPGVARSRGTGGVNGA